MTFSFTHFFSGYCILTNWYSVTKLDCAQMMGQFVWEADKLSNFDVVEKHLPSPEDGRESVVFSCRLHVYSIWKTAVEKVFPFKAQVTHHTQSTACLNSSVAVLLYGLLQKLLFCGRFLPAWLLIIAAETMRLKQKPIHFELVPWGTESTRAWCLQSTLL